MVGILSLTLLGEVTIGLFSLSAPVASSHAPLSIEFLFTWIPCSRQ